MPDDHLKNSHLFTPSGNHPDKHAPTGQSRSWWLDVPEEDFSAAAKQRDAEMRSNPYWRKPRVHNTASDVP